MEAAQLEIVSSSEIDAGRRFETGGVLVVVPFTEAAQARRAARMMAGRAGTGGLVLAVHDDRREGFASLVNRVFRASDSPWFCYAAQDAFAGRQWLARGLHALNARQGVLLGFNDGKWHGALAAFGMVRRAWAQGNYQGDLFFPGYQRHYADAELTLLAMQAQRYVYTPDSVLMEVDWEKDRTPVDAADRALYLRRAEAGFDGRVTAPALQRAFA